MAAHAHGDSRHLIGKIHSQVANHIIDNVTGDVRANAMEAYHRRMDKPS